jgi:hypothetical protein
VPLSKVQPRGELLEAIVYEARDELLQRIETTATGITHRIADHKPLGTGDEWRTFVKLQRQYEQVAALGGEEARRIAYNAVHAPVCNLGAWLFNQRDEKSIANGMFQWLLLEATDVGDDDDIRRYRKNVDCGP